jgi:hypothetical protein
MKTLLQPKTQVIAHSENEKEGEAMKANVFVLGICVLLACTGCNRLTDDATAKEVAALEGKVQTLEKRNSDLALKGQIVSSQLFSSGLDRFFGEPEFWENPYDVGQAECAKRCITTLTSERKACEDIADATQRLQCFQGAVDRASTCQQQCASRFPPPIR